MLKKVVQMLEGLNAMSLALGVIIGGAVGKVVGSLTSDILMPLVSLVIPGGSWRDAEIVLTRDAAGVTTNAVKVGVFAGTIVDFLIIALVVQWLTRALVRPAAAPAAAPATKKCPECCESVLSEARRCRHCGSAC